MMIYQFLNDILGFILFAYIMSLFFWIAKRLPG